MSEITGSDVYVNDFLSQIEKYIEKSPHKEHLKGFSNYISNLAPTSIYNYIGYVSDFLKTTKKEPVNLNIDDYTSYIVSKRGNSSKQLGAYAALKKYSKYLYVREINKYHMIDVDRPKEIEDFETLQKREKGYLEKDEIKAVIEAVKEGVGSQKAKARQKKWKDRDMLIIKLFLTTGMRCAELYKLDTYSIDVEKQKIITMGKGRKTQEHDLTDDIMNLIHKWIYIRNIIMEVPTGEIALFVNNDKKRMSRKALERLVKKYTSVIEDKNITPHKLRATYGSELYEQTKDIHFVQACMGHSSVTTTERYIRGKNKDCRKKAAAIMNDLF